MASRKPTASTGHGTTGSEGSVDQGEPSSAKIGGSGNLQILHTAEEAAVMFRTTRRAIYNMAQRGQLPGVVRLGRRLLFRRDRLLEFIAENGVPSPREF